MWVGSGQGGCVEGMVLVRLGGVLAGFRVGPHSSWPFAPRFQTLPRATRLFCDIYDPQSKRYCKRLQVLCPEHSRDPKVRLFFPYLITLHSFLLCLTTLFLSSSLHDCPFLSSFCLTAFIPPDQPLCVPSTLYDHPTFPPPHWPITFYSFLSSAWLLFVHTLLAWPYPTFLSHSMPDHPLFLCSSLHNYSPFFSFPCFTILHSFPTPWPTAPHSSLPFCMATFKSSLLHSLTSLYSYSPCLIALMI